MQGREAATAIACVSAPRQGGPSRRRLVWLATTGAAFLALAVWAHLQPILPGDVRITRVVQAVEAPWLHWLLMPFNRLGFPPLVDVVYGAITLAIYLSGNKWEAGACAFSGIGTAGLNFVIKELVARPRPPAELVHVERQISSSTFPAGHVLNFTAFAGFLAYLAWTRLAPSWRRTSLVATLAVMIALMGLARIDSGEHWASDVLGGYLLGGLWLTATIAFYRWVERREVTRARPAAPRASGRPLAG